MRSRVTQQVSGQSIASGLVWSFNISARPTVAVISLMTFNELGKETNNKTNEGRVRRKGEFKEWVEKLRPQNWWKVPPRASKKESNGLKPRFVFLHIDTKKVSTLMGKGKKLPVSSVSCWHCTVREG
ncbi:hypothetical protein OUZ56_013256 [Daphnia magna]|uniref:Uncharacterized protein n=1 Tax=Daphnia magna TaxID=35525 RepID=A0ABQ9Z5E5_9CRUS|nr:hypothetical protein OUZ56_013256 [Daphnia magna]